MNCIIYAKNANNITVFEQHNVCAEKAKRYGYSVAHRIFDIRGDRFTEAINKVTAHQEIEALIIYDKWIIFKDYDEFLFYYIYLRKLGKKLILAK